MRPDEPRQPGNDEHPDLARTLQGVLPCARCGYELRGLSIRSACPECGLSIRATLLAAVDPAADELQPLRHVRLLVAGLIAWTVGALLAGVGVLAMRVIDLLDLAIGPWSQRRIALAAIAGLIVSWAGAIVLVRPHDQTPRVNVFVAMLAMLFYAGAIGCFIFIHLVHDPFQTDPAYTIPGVVVPLRSAVRLLMGACLIVAILGFRPNARMLAARSLILRTGRVDRQPMFALAGAVGVAMLGDLGHLLSVQMSGGPSDILWAASALLIAVGSMLLLVGLAGLTLDGYRVSRVLLEPSPSMRQVLHGSAKGNRDDVP